jgi:hypothetical protein
MKIYLIDIIDPFFFLFLSNFFFQKIQKVRFNPQSIPKRNKNSKIYKIQPKFPTTPKKKELQEN